MELYFGIVKTYNIERGFGFLTHPNSLGPKKDCFFHISKVNRSNSDLAEKLLNYEVGDKICFWYTAEFTLKGEQLQWILMPLDVFNHYQNDLPDAKDTVREIWSNTDVPLPFWITDATLGLCGTEENEKLIIVREELTLKRNAERELRRKEQEKLREIWEFNQKIEQEKLEKERKRVEEERAFLKKKAEEEATRKQEIAKQKETLVNSEFELLVEEMKSKGFKKSAEVSEYIIRNKLGNKYPNISGVLEMTNTYTTWKFYGGFPPLIYRMLCERLNLGNNETDSKVVGFQSFADLNRKTQN